MIKDHAYEFQPTHNNATEDINEPDMLDDVISWGHSRILRMDSTESTTTEPGSREEVIRLELESYEKEPLLERDNKPQPWWEMCSSRYPLMFPLATKLMTIPPSSVESERIFSVGTQIYSPKRNSLKPSTSETLMFLNYNLRYLHHIYEFDIDAHKKITV